MIRRSRVTTEQWEEKINDSIALKIYLETSMLLRLKRKDSGRSLDAGAIYYATSSCKSDYNVTLKRRSLVSRFIEEAQLQFTISSGYSHRTSPSFCHKKTKLTMRLSADPTNYSPIYRHPKILFQIEPPHCYIIGILSFISVVIFFMKRTIIKVTLVTV